MAATYSDAHRRLNHVLSLFFVASVTTTLIGAIHREWWLAAVWFAAAIIVGVIEFSSGQAGIEVIPADGAVIGDDADEKAFACKFLELANLLAATALATGFAIGNPWWSNLLAAAIAWFLGMVGIPLLCGPIKNDEGEDADFQA